MHLQQVRWSNLEWDIILDVKGGHHNWHPIWILPLYKVKVTNLYIQENYLFLIQTLGQDGYISCHCHTTTKAQVSAVLNNCLHFVNVESFRIFLIWTHGSQSIDQQQHPHLEIRKADFGAPASDLDLNQKLWGGPRNLFFLMSLPSDPGTTLWIHHPIMSRHLDAINFKESIYVHRRNVSLPQR